MSRTCVVGLETGMGVVVSGHGVLSAVLYRFRATKTFAIVRKLRKKIHVEESASPLLPYGTMLVCKLLETLPMADRATFDVFLSHNIKDKPAVIGLTKRLQAHVAEIIGQAPELAIQGSAPPGIYFLWNDK